MNPEQRPVTPVTIIRPPRGFSSLGLNDLWIYRELLYFLAWRDVKVRYKQTVLGLAWAIIQPVGTMVVFSIFFGKLANIPSDGLPYPLFTFVALLPWQLFSYSLSTASQSTVGQSALITKIYCPRLIIPVSSILGGLVDFVVAFGVLVIMMFAYSEIPAWRIVFLPGFIIMALATALGVGLWLAALNVHYRDVRYTLPFLTQFWLFISPVAYPASMVPGKWQWIYGVNPMAGVVEGFRWAILGNAPAPGIMLFISIAVTVVILISGVYYFRRMDRTFADVV
ncbi:MAG: ABC transporter permease [Dehalococcoidia bacterium]